MPFITIATTFCVSCNTAVLTELRASKKMGVSLLPQSHRRRLFPEYTLSAFGVCVCYFTAHQFPISKLVLPPYPFLPLPISKECLHRTK